MTKKKPRERPTVVQLLEQSEYWISADGKRTTLKKMDAPHLENLLGWFLRNAESLKFSYEVRLFAFGVGIRGEYAADDFDHLLEQHAEVSAKAWLSRMPLVEAIREELWIRSERKGP